MDVRALAFGVLLGGLALVAALIVMPFLTYVLAALLLAFVLYPIHRRLAPRVGARLSAFGLVAVATASTVGTVLVVIATLPANIETITDTVEQLVSRGRVARLIERAFGGDVRLGPILDGAPQRVTGVVAGQAIDLTSAVVHTVLGVFLLAFLLYYLLKDGRRLRAWIEDTVPIEPPVRDELVDEASEVTWAVLKGHVFVAIVQGVVAGVGLVITGVPNVVFWTLVMIVLALVPIVGVAAVFVPAIAYLALAGRPLAAAFLVVYGLTAVAAIDDYLRAIVVDRESSLHSAVVLLGVLGGVYVFGVMGIFFGPVALGLFAVSFRLFNEHYVSGGR